MDDEGRIVPVIFSDSIEFHLDDECKVVFGKRVKCFLDFSSLHEVVARKILIIRFGRHPKSLDENVFSMRIVVKLIEKPSAIEFEHAIGIIDILCQIRMSVLEIASNIFQTLEISPNPIAVTNCSLIPDRGISLYSLVSANTNIFLHQHHAIHLCLL